MHLQLKDFSETQKTENTTEEVEKMHSILKKLYAQQDCECRVQKYS